MSASDAPYTIEDYCKGIEEPPSLNLGTNYKDANDFINNIFYRSSNVDSVEIVDGKFTITKVEGNTSSYYILVNLDKTIRAGSRVKLKYSGVQIPYQIALHKNAIPNTNEGYQPFATMQQAGTYYLTANTDYDYIMIYGLSSSSLLSFNYIELEVLGADYSYSDDVNLVQVKDNSGNNNHAFIYGSVMADKNKEPANITASVEFDKNAISALPIISTNANTIQKNQLITLKLKASISSNFNLGTLTDATYCGVVNLEANEWKSITIESSLDSPLILTPQSALQEKCKIKLILNYERII